VTRDPAVSRTGAIRGSAFLLAGVCLALASGCALSSSPAPAEVDFMVRGKVVDAATGEPLPQVLVVVVEAQALRVITGRQGEFEIRGTAKPGRYKLRLAGRVGYRPRMRRFRVRQAGTVDVGVIEVRPGPLFFESHPVAPSH
jgi:hypothetical protein